MNGLKLSLVKREDVQKKMVTVWYVILVLSAFARIVLSSGYVYDYIVNAGMDDQWMVKTAYYLLGRQWMGPYSHVTLIKSIAYPAILATFRALGIPYGMGIGIIIVAVSFVFARAIRPIVKNVFFRGIIFISVMYSPFGFLTLTSARIYRNSISHWMALFVIASVIGVYLRRDWSFKKMWKWIICEIVSLGLFWELREDHIWIIAFVLPAAVILLVYWIYHKKGFFKTVFVVALPFVTTVIMELGIAFMNYHSYGVFTTNDRTGTYCGKVISLLYKIDDGQKHESKIWVSNGALALAKEASPTLNGLSANLDPDWGYWFVATEYGNEVPGDHAEWAIRQTLLDSGYYRDAVNTNEVYKRIYNELKEGFKSGKLKEKDGIFLSSQMRPFNMDDMKEALDLTWKVMDKYARYDSTGVYVAYTTAGMDEKEKKIFENMLLTNIVEYRSSGDTEEMDIGDYASATYSEFIMGILNNIWKVYKRVANFLNYLVIGIFIFMIISMIFELRQKRFYSLYAFMLTGGVFLLLVAYTFMICLWGLWMTTDPNSSVYWFYGSPGPMLAQVLRILCLVYLGNRLVQIFGKEKLNGGI